MSMIQLLLEDTVQRLNNISAKEKDLEILRKFINKECINFDIFTLELFSLEYINMPMKLFNPYLLENVGYFTISNIFQRAIMNKIFKGNISAKTVDNYVSDFNRFCRFDNFDKKHIMKIDTKDLKIYVYKLFRYQALNSAAYKNLKTLLHLIFNYAIDNDIIKENPVDKLLTYDDYYTFITNKKCTENNNFTGNSILGREHKKVMLRIKAKNITELDYLSSCFYLQMDTYEFSEKVKEYNILMNEKGHYLISDLNKLKKCA